MEHTSKSQRPRDRSPTRQKSSRQSTETTNDDYTRDRDVKSPARTYYPSGRREHRADHRPARRPRSPGSGSGTEIRQPLRTHLPNYPTNIPSTGIWTSTRHEQLQGRRPGGSRRVIFDLRYERETEATVRHIFIDKPGDQGWLHAIGVPRIVMDDRRQSNDGTRSRPEATTIDDLRRCYHTQRTDVSRGRGESRVEGKASSRSHSDEAMSGLTTANLKSCSKSAEREYQQTLRRMPHQTVVAKGEARTRQARNSDSKAKSSGPQISQLPAHRVRYSPNQQESSPVSAGFPDGGGSQAAEGIRGTATDTYLNDEAMTSLSKDSVFAYYFNPPTAEPVDEEQPRGYHDRRRSGNEDPSRSKRTKSGGHRRSHHPGPSHGGSYSYEKTKTTTTYPRSQSGCCVVL